MLYQRHSSGSGNKNVCVVRFGSRTLSHYQMSYGPTKHELLSVVTSILDCASYLGGSASQSMRESHQLNV